MMRHIMRLGVSVCMLLVAGCAGSSSLSKVGAPAPAYAPFYLLDEGPQGKTLTLPQLRGKYAVIFFWETGCPTSHKVIEELNAYMARPEIRRKAVALAVSIDKSEDESRVREKVEIKHLSNMVHVFSGNDIYDEAKVAFEVDTIPFFFVVDPQGVVVSGGDSMSDVTRILGE